MQTLEGFPYYQLQFDKKGRIFSNDEVRALLDAPEKEGITDLVFISHGWNNDIADATSFYSELLANIRIELDAGSAGGLVNRTLGFVGVLWPSKRFTPIRLQPGGGASLDDLITEEMILEELDTLMDISDTDDAASLIEQAKALVAELEDRKTSQDKFVDLVRQILADTDKDTELESEIPEGLDILPGRDVVDLLSRPGVNEFRAGSSGAAGFGDFFCGIKGGVMNFLNMTTYWKMKKRAGKIGQGGLYEVLGMLKDRSPDLAVHLVGHSFGGRLVSAAARGPDNQPSVSVKTLSLLQAAFSHNGFAENFNDSHDDGYFRRVITQQHVVGPILVTHTKNDKAVGMAYPLASRINRDDSAALGDENDRFGGIGRNGAQHTPEAISLMMEDHSGIYSFEAGTVYNLKADSFISDHGDVKNKAVANAIIFAIASV